MTVVTENRTCWLTAESRHRLTVEKGACAIICHDFQNSFKRRATAGLPATSSFEQLLLYAVHFGIVDAAVFVAFLTRPTQQQNTTEQSNQQDPNSTSGEKGFPAFKIEKKGLRKNGFLKNGLKK